MPKPIYSPPLNTATFKAASHEPQVVSEHRRAECVRVYSNSMYFQSPACNAHRSPDLNKQKLYENESLQIATTANSSTLDLDNQCLQQLAQADISSNQTVIPLAQRSALSHSKERDSCKHFQQPTDRCTFSLTVLRENTDNMSGSRWLPLQGHTISLVAQNIRRHHKPSAC